MNNAKVKRIGTVLFLIGVLAALGLFLVDRVDQPDFKYMAADCQIFSVTGKKVFSFEGYHNCDFRADGTFVAAKDSLGDSHRIGVNAQDKQGELTRIKSILKFTADTKGLWGVAYRSFEFKSENVLDACISKTQENSDNAKKWCIGDHLDDLAKAGLLIERPGKSAAYYFLDGKKFDKELAAVSSMYEITDEKLAHFNAAFAVGNVVVNLRGPSLGVIILDAELKKLVWAFDLRRIHFLGSEVSLYASDVQINEQGQLLLYVNFMLKDMPLKDVGDVYAAVNGLEGGGDFQNIRNKQQGSTSRIAEINVDRKEVVWVCSGTPEQGFDSSNDGAVTPLHDGRFLVTNTTFGGEAFILNRSCQISWKFRNPELNRRGLPVFFSRIRPMYDTNFLKARGLL